MNVIAQIHFFVGSCTVLAGFTAMFNRKGAAIHRGAGKVFFTSMVLLCFSGFYRSYSRDLQFTYLLSALALYLVLTGWLAAKNIEKGITYGDKAGLAYILALCIVSFVLSFLDAGLGWEYPATEPPYTAYAFIGVCGSPFMIGDLKYLATEDPTKSIRLKRHLERMCSSMLIARVIFFLGNNHVLPVFLRTPSVLLAPVIVVILFMLIYRIGFQRFAGQLLK